MIGFLKGQVLEVENGRLILMAGPVGYAVQIPQTPEALLIRPGQDLDLWIHTHVREDDIQLFGFASRMERELFLVLTSVSGVGPKAGLALLSGIPAGELIQAILAKNMARLTEAPGVGKKLAERIVVEAHDSVRKKVEAGLLLPSAGARVQGPGGASARDTGKSGAGRAFGEARTALLSLGYREADFASILAEEATQDDAKIEDVLKRTLQRLA